ncbi:hypothetical protein [uncultured Psychrobacter sp.]|uniref:hypothetical protein n=1 Tax=uncultured Psychrobacter sp. TaxID=259303 RepID=UPI00345A42C5
MPSQVLLNLLNNMSSIKPKSPSSSSELSNQLSFKHSFISQKAKVLKLFFVLGILSFSVGGCATLQALEPTAVLISDIKDIL